MSCINKTYFLLIFSLALISGCRQDCNSTNIEKAISQLEAKFTQLPKGKSKQINYYKLVRSVTNGEKEFQLQLRSSPDSISDPQKIILIINSKGNCYAIPFFSNTYRDYWNFQFDRPVSTIKKTNTTFEKELKTAIDTLGLNDRKGTQSAVVYEMLFSLLHCIALNEGDSTELHVSYINNNYTLPEEDDSIVYERLNKNYKAISKEWHPYENINNYNAYLDKENRRVYQFLEKKKKQPNKFDYSIKTYRLDYVFHLIYL